MIYQFILLSDEINDFARAISIDSEATFFDLHKAIIESVGFSDKEMSSFFICNEEWEKQTEVTLIDMGVSSEYDTWVMDQTKLEELIEEEKQKALYVFDMMTERAFFIDLHQIITGKTLEKAVCTGKKGNPPVQIMEFDSAATFAPLTGELGEDFYGDEGYNEDELDIEGYEGLDAVADMGYSDDRF